jgi:hypothetical protein
MVILKWVLSEKGLKAWTVLRLPRIGSAFGFCECSVGCSVDLLVGLAPSARHVLKNTCLKLDAVSVRPAVSEDVLVCR